MHPLGCGGHRTPPYPLAGRLAVRPAGSKQAAGPAGGMLVASAAQGVHSRRDCGKIAFEIPSMLPLLSSPFYTFFSSLYSSFKGVSPRKYFYCSNVH